MLIPYHHYIPVLLLFLLLAITERVWNTFFSNNSKPTNAIYFKWSFTVLFYSYLFIVCMAISEFVLNKKDINSGVAIWGLFIYFIGVLLRRKSICDLDGNWSVYIEIKKSHELVSKGIYKYLSHPYCLAVLLELFGLSCITNSYYSMLLIVIIQIPLLTIRILLEEKVLSEHFGNVYFEKYK